LIQRYTRSIVIVFALYTAAAAWFVNPAFIHSGTTYRVLPLSSSVPVFPLISVSAPMWSRHGLADFAAPSSEASPGVQPRAESEIVALSAAIQEAVYLRKLANELGFTQTSPTTLCEDCTAAVALSKENRFRNRSKHIALRWSFVSERQHPSVGDIQVISVSRKIMLADIFASPRPAASFIPFRDSLLGRTLA
jgi:hypothetical protein